MSQRIVVLTATMSGNAEMAADVVLEEIEAAGLEGRIVPIEKLTAERLSQGGLFVVCTSTYGTGEVPDKAKPLIAALQAERPDLSRVRYAVFGLGDSIYPATFCFGGKVFDDAFQSLGAVKVGERCEYDTRGSQALEDAAASWAKPVVEQLGLALAA